MSINDIMFNPYDENISTEIVNIIEEYLSKTHPKVALQELSDRIFYDNSVGWREPLLSIFQKNNKLANQVPAYYYELIRNNCDEFLPQFTYLVTFLIAEKILPVDVISHMVVKSLNNKEAKYILMAFLASWDIEIALDLDAHYVKGNFEHIIYSSKLKIKELILSSSRNESYFSVIENMLMDVTVQYYFNQEIQRIIRSQNKVELEELDIFLEKCNRSEKEQIIEFIADLIELNTIQKFLKESWNFNLLERLYKNFALNAEVMSSSLKEITINALNRLKRNLDSDFAIAARQEIHKLKENDKKYIIKRVGELSEAKITQYNEVFTSPENGQWDWKDYANHLVRYYKEKHPNEDVVNVIQLAKDLGLKTIIKKLETEQFDACLVRDCTLKVPVIIVNSTKKSIGRVNFSIAHEIAHAILPHHAQNNFFCFLDDVTETSKIKMDKQLEREANNFAAYILLPYKQFVEDISRMDFTIKNVKRLSKKYNASWVLVAKKWVELSKLDIAMVFSEKGIVDWWTRSESFPYYRIEGTIHKQSSVFRVIELEGNKVSRKNITFDKWFQEKYPIYRIQEQSYSVFEDKVLTLIQIIDED
ncbi:ImmA/IrrE family metallo-endopeptidase [Bacillus thuringiensis]|uniref:ImmA/IrrE family metallo-endopeptidase n=1 Tax=Bacillus thuringiensis TaxID=1428 RepID=UPI000CF84757|nr:ImmA/IrrE family metallo-endopeptidase [Bacillus thuringiensis]PQQ45504.1 hypothetical protein C6A34_19440 [Bacillus thuringiensis]